MSKYLYVQLWRMNTEWLGLSEQERLEFVYQIGIVIKDLIKEGSELVGFSLNDHDTPERVEYRYMAVWKTTKKNVERIDNAFKEAGWNEYFSHVNARGEAVQPQEFLRHMIHI